MGCLMPKPSLWENNCGNIQPVIGSRDKGTHTCFKSICPKVNIIVRLEFEIAYYDVAVQ